MTTARLKTPVREVWQYDMHGVHPSWVMDSTEWHSDGLYLVRRSGKQRIEFGDWLLRDLDDRDPEWVDDATFQREYELT